MMHAQTTTVRPLAAPNPPTKLLEGPVRMARDVHAHAHLWWSLVLRDIRLKYRESALGYFWSLLEPLLLSGVYYVLYTLLSSNREREMPLWVIIGVITWGFFSRSVNMAVTALTRNDGLIKQVYFPRELFALTPITAQLIMASLSLFIAVPGMLYYQIAPTPRLLMVPVGLLLTGMLALGIGLSMACINVVNRDTEHLFRFLTRAGLYISPVIWTIHSMPASRAKLIDFLLLNPMVVPLTMIRTGIGGMELGISWGYVVYSIVFCTMALIVGAMVFKRFEGQVIKKL